MRNVILSGPLNLLTERHLVRTGKGKRNKKKKILRDKNDMIKAEIYINDSLLLQFWVVVSFRILRIVQRGDYAFKL